MSKKVKLEAAPALNTEILRNDLEKQPTKIEDLPIELVLKITDTVLGLYVQSEQNNRVSAFSVMGLKQALTTHFVTRGTKLPSGGNGDGGE